MRRGLALMGLCWLVASGAAARDHERTPTTTARPAAPTAEAPDVCDAVADGMPDGPLRTSLHDGELGQARTPCPRSEVAAGATGLIVADVANFYGNVVLSANLWGAWDIDGGTTGAFAAVEAVRYQTVISSVTAEHIGPGHVSVGMTRRLLRAASATLGVGGRLVLPTALLLYDNAWPVGLDVGLGGGLAPTPRLRLFAEVGAQASWAFGSGPADPRAGFRITTAAAYRLLSWLAVASQAELSMGWAAALDVVAVGLGLRLAFGQHLGAEVGVLFPIAGRDRTDLAGALRVGWRL